MSMTAGDLHRLAKTYVEARSRPNVALERLHQASEGDNDLLVAAAMRARSVAASPTAGRTERRVLALLEAAAGQTDDDTPGEGTPHPRNVGALWRAGDLRGFTEDLTIDLDRLHDAAAREEQPRRRRINLAGH
jgi:hypothetical protein